MAGAAAALQVAAVPADAEAMDASAYAFAHGVRHTRATLRTWQRTPGSVLRKWVAGSAVAATGLLLAVWIVSSLDQGYQQILTLEPPFAWAAWATCST